MSNSAIFPPTKGFDLQYSTVINRKMKIPEHIFTYTENNPNDVRVTDDSNYKREVKSEVIDLIKNPSAIATMFLKQSKKKKPFRPNCRKSRLETNTSSILSEMLGNYSAGDGKLCVKDVSTITNEFSQEKDKKHNQNSAENNIVLKTPVSLPVFSATTPFEAIMLERSGLFLKSFERLNVRLKKIEGSLKRIEIEINDFTPKIIQNDRKKKHSLDCVILIGSCCALLFYLFYNEHAKMPRLNRIL